MQATAVITFIDHVTPIDQKCCDHSEECGDPTNLTKSLQENYSTTEQAVTTNAVHHNEVLQGILAHKA